MKSEQTKGERGKEAKENPDHILMKEERPCKDCKNMSKLWDGWSYCDKLLMRIIPDMNVAYYKDKGTCFEPKLIE